MKIPVLSVYLARFRFQARLGVILLSALVLAAGTLAAQDRHSPDRTGKVLVLDPGHGGHDKGADNGDDILEKEMVLQFAERLSKKLKPAYTVHLTRSDDYEVDLMHRPAVANHLKADLFLSIHAGASALHNHSGILIAYHDNQFSQRNPDTNPSKDTSSTENRLPPWGEKSPIHLEKSRYLADLLKEKMLEYDPEVNVDILGMPIAVLEGADQPGLLIEIGYLTNPADLRKLKNETVLEDYSNVIRNSLDTYFSSRSD